MNRRAVTGGPCDDPGLWLVSRIFPMRCLGMFEYNLCSNGLI